MNKRLPSHFIGAILFFLIASQCKVTENRRKEFFEPQKLSGPNGSISLAQKTKDSQSQLSQEACLKQWDYSWDSEENACMEKGFLQLCNETKSTSSSVLETIRTVKKHFKARSCIEAEQFLAAAQTLQIVDKNINDLRFLRSAKTLKSLRLAYNEINDLRELGSRPSLQELRLAHNRIKDPTLDLPDLRVLVLSHNPLRSLYPLSRLNKLESLQLTNTTREDVDSLSELTELRSLSLSDNELEDEHLSFLQPMKKLERLYLDWNRIETLENLAHLEEIQILTLDHNRLQDLTPLSQLTKLKVLKLKNNQIFNIQPLKNLKELIELNLGSNIIRDISVLESLDKLEYLNLAKCQVPNFEALLNLTKLRYLNLSKCKKGLTTEEREKIEHQNPEIRLIL